MLGPSCRYHQYKFIVDGEWRHDEMQPFMPDPLGNVNNWLFVRKPESQSVPQQLQQAQATTSCGPFSALLAVQPHLITSQAICALDDRWMQQAVMQGD